MSKFSQRLDEFKTEIRSVLITLPRGLLISQLSRDYKQMVGTDLPFRQLGFSNVAELLRAVPDAVRLEKRGGDTIVCAVCDEKTAHLAEMVSRQKKSNTGYPKYTPADPSGSGKNVQSQRHPLPRQGNTGFDARRILPSQPTCIPLSLKFEVEELMAHYPLGLNVDNLKIAFRRKYGVELNHQDFHYSNIADFAKALSIENVLRLQEHPNCTLVFPLHREETALESWNRMEKIYNNLRKVLERFPDGLPLTEFSSRYREVTGSPLDCRPLGFFNMQEVVDHYPDIIRVKIRKDGEWILTDKAQNLEETPDQIEEADDEEDEIPEEVKKNIYDLLYNFKQGLLLSQIERIYKNIFFDDIPWKNLKYKSLHTMLMALDFDTPIRFVNYGLNDFRVKLMSKEPISDHLHNDHVPSKTEPVVPNDAVLLGEDYTLPKVPPMDDHYFPVLVSSSDSPGKIWLQVLCEEEARCLELENLTYDLEDFYRSCESDLYRIPEQYLRFTMNCAVMCPEDKTWHRGSIIGKPGPTTYEVFYYDYGTISVVEKDLLRLLKKSFTVLPAQAFRARLAHVEPLSKFFSSESAKRLMDLTNDKPLMALITSKQYMDTISVILCDTSGEEDIFLNDLLITENIVKQVDDDQYELRNPCVSTSPAASSCKANFEPSASPSRLSNSEPSQQAIADLQRSEAFQRMRENQKKYQEGTNETLKENGQQISKELNNSMASRTNNSVCCSDQLRFCKRVNFKDSAYAAHLINYYGKPCFTSADVSSFVFGIDIVKRILHLQKYPPCHIVASREEHSALFTDLEKSEVSGFSADDTKESKVVLYKLSDIVKILRFLNCKGETLIEDIEELNNNFNSKDRYWQTRPDPIDDLSNNKEALNAKLCELRKEREILLRTMLDEDATSAQDVEYLIHLDSQLSKLKNSLSEVVNRPATRSVSEQESEFQQRLMLGRVDIPGEEVVTADRQANSQALSNWKSSHLKESCIDKLNQPQSSLFLHFHLPEQ